MLTELNIKNFAVIREAHLEFGPGLNALTGETGAGKSIVLDALGAVLGERTASDVIRSGEERAYVEAIFVLPEHRQTEELLETLLEFGIEQQPGEPLILSRDIVSNGRSTARVNGRALTASALSTIGAHLVDIHGQSDHLSLLRPGAQLDLLDRFAHTVEQRRQVSKLYREWRDHRRRVESFESEQRERAQRLDLLRFQLDEIDTVSPQPDEDTQLEEERVLLAHAERLMQAALSAHGTLSGEDELDAGTSGALDAIRLVEANLEEMSRYDKSTEGLLSQVREALFTLEEVDTELRDYGDRLQFDPGRLEEVNHRLAQLRELVRKYGPDLESVIAYRNEINAEVSKIAEENVDLETLRSQERKLAAKLAEAALELSSQRQEAAGALSEQVVATIAELNMGRAGFDVGFERREDPHGIPVNDELVAVDETGIDRIQFRLAANAGDQLRPLGRVASGGETARLMLAMKSILSDVDETPTLIFDEIDVGVGGRSGQVVGEKLWGLTDHHQVIVITHLAQVASFADQHTVMIKHEIEQRAETHAEQLANGQIIDEIAAMLDGLPVTPESEANAQALVRRVGKWKESRR